MKNGKAPPPERLPPLLEPRQVVRCPALRLTLSAESCAARAVAKWPSGRRRGAPRFMPCGTCLLGQARARVLAAGGWRPPRDEQPPEVLSPEQRAAKAQKRALVLIAESEPWTQDPLVEASALSPDDDTDWRA